MKTKRRFWEFDPGPEPIENPDFNPFVGSVLLFVVVFVVTSLVIKVLKVGHL